MNRLNTSQYTSKNGIYFIIDRQNCNGGLMDRLKAAVGLCYIARENGIGFKFIHKAGFDIRDYLRPNKINWSAGISDISPLLWNIRIIKYQPPFKDFPVFQDNKQYICRSYNGNNLLQKTGVPEWKRVWRELFWDMFTPSNALQQALDGTGLPEHFCAVHTRFINSLGWTEKAPDNAPLPEDMQTGLIDAILRKISECEKESDAPVIVFSDNIRFLKIAAENGFRTSGTQGVGNIVNQDADRHTCMKTFVDFLQISRAEKIYSIRKIEGFPENCLYASQYPYYAAIIGNRPYVKIQ